MYASQQLSLTSACVRRLVPALIYAGCLHHDAFFFFLTRASAKTLSTNRVMVRDGHSPSRVSASFCERWRGFDTRAAASQGGSCLTRILINICSPSTHCSKEDACADKLVLSHITVQPGALKGTK